VPPGIHAGGLRYHGMGPLISHLVELGEIEAVAVHQLEIFEAATRFARSEGIIPAPEPAHALAITIREALRCKEDGQSRAIVLNLCGHGHFDMQAYLDYFAGKLHDYEYPAEEIAMALAGLPSVGSE
jgi:tryptophan synthase beta chain